MPCYNHLHSDRPHLPEVEDTARALLRLVFYHFEPRCKNSLDNLPPQGVTDPAVIRSLCYCEYRRKNMSSSSGTPESWITSFCSLLGHEYFAEISEDFVEDDFNLTGLQTQVAMYKEALEVCEYDLPRST